MFDIIRMGLILVVVGAAAALSLAVTQIATKDPIEAARRQEVQRNLDNLLPKGFDNEPVSDTIALQDKRLNRKEKPVTFYRATAGGKNHSAAFVVTAPDGYSGNIEIMIGVKSGGEITGVQIITHNETPGLGDKATDPKWLEKFIGKKVDNARWGVKKDGGEFDQFAGATITPRAIVKAVKAGLDYFVENEAKIFERSAP